MLFKRNHRRDVPHVYSKALDPARSRMHFGRGSLFLSL
ncbi:hypothetical protein GRAN_2924 [Granulicella sibirica]|uniref:Uncharacterized protein n=1 Tax=Granulicella sibirica TaxID=2479048 RepID=A0A4Q0SYZ8_9BACT|nr:hypothetical protein GRAN_2924 [Granulicella sibirica]